MLNKKEREKAGGKFMRKAFVNGTVYTMKAENDVCSAFVVEDGKFIFCGSDEEAKAVAASE